MAHDVGGAGGGLVGRHREGVGGVADGDGRIGIAVADLLAEGHVGDHTATVELGAGRRDGEHVDDGQCAQLAMARGDHVPQVALPEDAGRDGLAAVDGGATANCQDDVDAVLSAELHAALDRLDAGVGLDAVELGDLEVPVAQDVEDGVVEAGPLDRAAAVGQ